MSLQFIIGSSGSGKTRRLYEDLIGWSMREPESQFIAIVPEQFTMQTQKEIVALHPYHGTSNIDIVSFNRLAWRVFEELAVENPDVLDDMGKSMVLRKVAAREKRDLELYSGHLNQTGFINQLKSMLSELYQYGVKPEDLERVRDGASGALLKAKCGDLARIYRAFQEEISKRFITAEEVLDVLCREIPRSRLIKNSVVTLDGYTGFTPVQYRILELLMLHARRVVVTATVDVQARPYSRGRIQDLFYMGKEMICRLIETASRNGVTLEQDILLGDEENPRERESGEKKTETVPVRFRESPSLAFIEKNLYRYGKAAASWKPEEVNVWQAPSPSAEIAAVAARIHHLVRKEGVRYRQIAVITGDLPGYKNEITNRFRQEQIPFFMDDKKSILENPMVEFIRAALEVIRRDFDYESVFRYLKTGLVSDDAEELFRLENYCAALGIRGFKRWNDTWEYTYRGGKTLNMDRLNSFRREILEPLAALREQIKREDRTIGTMNQAVIACLEACRVKEKLERLRSGFEESGQYALAREYEQVYGRVIEMLDRLSGLLGSESAEIREYAGILDAGFGEIRVGVIPATVDRLVVGDITRTRLDQISVLFFVGVNEGIVPGRKDPAGLLTDMDREMLKDLNVELAPTSREDSFTQRYYLYLMMTKPSRRLILSYSLSDRSGKSRRPSSLIGEMRRLFPLLEITDTEQMKDTVLSPNSGKEMLIVGLRKFAAGAFGQHPDGEDEKEDFLALYRWFSDLPGYSRQMHGLTDAAFYSYEKRGIGRAAARALYGTFLQGSVTRLEKYAECAYAHFLNYGLELTKRQEYQVEAADIGNLFHSAIDLCFKEMALRGIDAADLDSDRRRSLVKECVDRVTGEYGNTVLMSSARNRYLAERIGRMTERTVWALTEQLKKGDFRPEGFEVPFLALDDLKAMRIPLSDGEQLRLQGRIDRLDLCRDGEKIYVKIIDYKSGSTQFDLASVYHGLQLQLVVYMDAVMELTGRKNPGMEIIPAGIFYYNIRDPFVDREEGQTLPDIEQEILRQLRMNGLVNSDLEAISHLDREIRDKSDVIPVAVKDGLVVEGRSSVASGKRFEILRRYVREQLRRDGTEILEGNIGVEPDKEGGRTACDYCPYHSVCGFDTRIDGYRYRRFSPADEEMIWEEMEERTRESGPKTEESGRKGGDI